MTDDRTVERAARSWIEEGPTQAPDRAVERALLRIATTPQERDLRVPWRFPRMLTNRVTIAALTAVAVVALGGFAMSRLTGGTVVGGPQTSPSIAPSPSPVAEKTITTSDAGKSLPAGTYRVEEFAAPFSVTLPAGWTVRDFSRNSIAIEQRADGKINVYLAVINKVYGDPCHTTEGPKMIGSGVDDLVTSLSSMPGFEVSNIRDVTVGGADGRSFQIANSIEVTEAGCSGNMLPIGTYDRDGQDVDIAMFGGETDSFWVLDADGTRVFMAVTRTALEGTQAVRDSIMFGDPPTN